LRFWLQFLPTYEHFFLWFCHAYKLLPHRTIIKYSPICI
jgi:hypothetical protein